MTLISLGQGQNRAGFGYVLDSAAIQRAGWRLANVEGPMCACKGSRIKAWINPRLVSPGKYEVDIWSITSEPKDFPQSSGGVNCIRSTSKAADQYLYPQVREDLGDALNVLKLPFRGVTYGAAAITARYRFGIGNEWEKGAGGVTLAGYAAYMRGRASFTKRGIIHNAWSLGFALGATTVELTKETVDASRFQRSRTAFAFSGGPLVMYSRNNLGFMLTLGADLATGDSADQWMYQMRPWIGLGIGTNIGVF